MKCYQKLILTLLQKGNETRNASTSFFLSYLSILGGVHRPAGVEEGDGRGLPAERAQLLDCRAPLPRHALCLRPTVLDEQQKHIQVIKKGSCIKPVCLRYSVLCTLYSVLCTVYSVLCTLYSVLCTLYNYTLFSTLLYFCVHFYWIGQRPIQPASRNVRMLYGVWKCVLSPQNYIFFRPSLANTGDTITSQASHWSKHQGSELSASTEQSLCWCTQGPPAQC